MDFALEKKEPNFVHLVNDGDTPFTDKFGGRAVVIPPGMALRVPDYVANHFIGDPAIIGGGDKNAAAAEQKRIYLRYAAFKPEEREVKIPKLRIEPLPEEKEFIVVEAPPKKGGKRAKIQEPDEESFPDLKKKEG